MKPIVGNAWRYAVLIIFLFVIIAVAAHSVISHFEQEISALQAEQLSSWLSFAIWALTMGCMFITGALGLLAIRSASEAEGRQRIGRFVEVMDYLADGAIAVERNGVITGMNPAARELAPRGSSAKGKMSLRDVFDCLDQEEALSLAKQDSPYEVECDCLYKHGIRKLRFRSQPSAGVSLILVSDVTDMRSRENMERQAAQLQMIGRIAAGVAHDFNNILCAISGHASLLKRNNIAPETAAQSVDIIVDETQRGSGLSRQLLELSRSGVDEEPSRKISEDVLEAVNLLKIGLSPTWQVKESLDKDFGAVPLGSRQIVQVVFNLGMLAADSLRIPGVISVTLCKPGKTLFSHTDERFQSVIIVSAEPTQSQDKDNTAVLNKSVLPILDDSGVIISVVRSMVEEAGGIFQHFSGPDGLCVYRTCLPRLDSHVLKQDKTELPDDITGYLSQWSVIMACEGKEMEAFREKLEKFGVKVDVRTDVVSLLAATESSGKPDVMILHGSIIGNQLGLLRAIAKLCPETGLLVLSDYSSKSGFESCFYAVCEDLSASHDKLIRAMIEAKALAATRKKA